MNPLRRFLSQVWHVFTAIIFWIVVVMVMIAWANQDKVVKMINLPGTGYVESKNRKTVVMIWRQPFKTDTIYYDARK